MSKSITVQPGQTLADLAISLYGSLDAWAVLAQKNGLSMTATITPGQVLEVPEYEAKKAKVSEPNIVQPQAYALVQPNQTLADIAIQHCGGLDAWAVLARNNGLSMTATLIPGQKIEIPEIVDKRIAAFFKAGGYVPAVGSTITVNEGISYWGIEFDFIVQ